MRLVVFIRRSLPDECNLTIEQLITRPRRIFANDMLTIIVLLALTLTCNVRSTEPESLKVQTQNGWVIGERMADSLYSWRGIPYAQPPVDNLRFEPPQAPDKWTDVWNATYDRNSCITSQSADQSDILLVPQGDEDCLYINVYTPKPPNPTHHLPVMVWIYGGAFVAGESSYETYGPDQLVSDDVIFVSFNYRLGIFGFLSTNDVVAPGNAGLRDQIFALQWVKNNIESFGGDPNRVTLFGESAGAASVSYLVLSRLTKGLFKQAIMESGSALCLWASSKTSRNAAFATGTKLGIITLSSRDLVDRLKTVPAKKLQIASIITMGVILEADPLNGLVFAPVIEPESETAVVTDDSYENLMSGNFNQVTQLMGYNSAEAYVFRNLVKLLTVYLATYDLVPPRLVPSSMNANIVDVVNIGVKIRNFYAGLLGTMTFPNSNFLKYLTDNEFVRPIQMTANLTSQYANVYFYKFSYTSDPKGVGAAHGEDLRYLFNSDYNTTCDRFIKSCLTKLWTSFATTGNPSSSAGCGGIHWRPIGPDDRNSLYYIDINRTVTKGENPDNKSMNFWYNLFEEFANPPFSNY